MPFELEDDFGDDDALLNFDVDAMAAARRAGPAAGPRPGMGPRDARVAAPANAARHPPTNPRELSGSGFSGHVRRNGGYSRVGGSWHNAHAKPVSPPRWRSGHDAVDRAAASGAVRGNGGGVDSNQRTVHQLFAKKPAAADKNAGQRTLDGMFGGDKTNVSPSRARVAVNVALSMQSTRPVESENGGANDHARAENQTRPRPPPRTNSSNQNVDRNRPSNGFGGSGGTQAGHTPGGGQPVRPESMGTPDTNGLVAVLRQTQGMRLDPQTAQTYVYPGQLVRREYQFDMTRAALTTNSLVCLPTGLGKTLIAAVVMKNFHRWFPQGKVVFLAPTRPLVEQQKAACRDICGMPEADTCTLMGSTKRDLDGTRRSNWRDKRLFFCTPQTMENDLRDGVCPASDVVCLVIDEAHRAKGNHAYCMVAKQLWERNVEFRLLALTATPGHDVSEVQQVVRSLAIGRIDFRSDQDADVKKHTHKRSVKLETVTSTKADLQVVDLLRDALRPLVKKLLGLNAFADGGVFVTRFADGSSNNMVKPYTLLKAQNEMRAPGSRCQNQGLAFTIFQKAHFIAKVCELLTTHTPRVAVDYVGKEDQKAYVGNLFREFPAMREALDMLKSMAGKGAHHSPKMGKLQHIMRKHFSKNGEFSRVMIFTSFRDSVHDIVRACREMGDETQLDGAAGDDPRRGSVDPIPGQGTITTLFAGATGAGANTVDRKDSKSSSATGNDHRVKVAAFIGQGDTSKGGADGAGAARGTKGQSQKEQKAVLDAFRHGSLNTVVATSIGEEGLDIPAVDLIVFFDVVDIIRTIQRMGRTGRARDGNVVVLATEGKEAQKFKTEYDKYEYMLKSLGDPGRVFDFCNDCPRMLPPGHDPVVEFLKLGPTPEELSKIRAQTLKSAEKAQSGGPGGRSGVGGKKDPFAFQTRAWDAPLTIVETSLLAAYAHPNGASNELDLDRSAPFQRRATPVYNVGHGRLAVALMRGVSAAQGLPPPKDVAGKVIEGGAIARARDAARQKEEETAAAFAEENHPSQHFAPPVEWDGDEWERPAAAEEQNHAWSDEDDAWEPPFEDSREYVAPPYETDSPGEAAGVDRVAPVDLGAMETDPRIADEIAAENFDDDRSARAPTGATQRLDFSTQPATTQGANEPETVRAPLAHIALVSSQLTPRVPVGSKSPTAAESARRRLAERASQQSQQLQRSSEIEVRDDTHDDDDLDDDETVGDMAFHIEQRRLAALAKRRSVSAARSAEKRGGAKSAEKVTPNAKKSCDEHQARVSMPPPPPRASPAVAVSPATTVGGGWGGQDGATPVREDDTSGWGVCSDLSGEKRTREERDNEGDVSGWGAATHPSPAASCGGSQGWGNTSPVDTEGLAAPDTAGGGWGAPAHTSQDGFGGEWGVEADGDDADADDWGVWGSARRTPKETFQRTTGALPVPGHVAPTPDSEDLRLVKRRKRANSEKVQNDDDDEDETQPSLNPRRRGNRETEPEPAVKERSPSRRAATAASRRLKRTDATKAAVRRFVDDEAAGDDDDADGSGDDGWCTEDDEFIAATQEGDEDGNGDGNGNRFAYQAAANATPGTGTSGGVSRVISKFGPWSRLDVRDTPSPTQAPGHTPIASSQYGGSFIDDEVEDEDDGVGRVLSGGG